jgi:hypothetical protein
MDPESFPLINQDDTSSRHRHHPRHWVSSTLQNTWIILIAVGFLFLQQIVNGTLSAANMNGGLLIGLNQHFQPVYNFTNYSSCDGIWSCTFETCNVWFDPNVLYVARRPSPPCTNSTSLGSTWDSYSDWLAFRLSWIGLFVALGLQVITILISGVQLFSRRRVVQWVHLGTSLATLVTIEVSYILWMVFLHHFRHLAGDRPPKYLGAWTLGANIFLMVTTPLFYKITPI